MQPDLILKTQSNQFGNDQDIAPEFRNTFVGMTAVPIDLDTLLETRKRLRVELPERLSDKQRQFLKGLTRAEPDWTLLRCPYAAELPALRWKLANLETFRKRRPADFESQAKALETGLDAHR